MAPLLNRQVVSAGTAPRLVAAYRSGRKGDGIVAVFADVSRVDVRKSGGGKYGFVSQVNGRWHKIVYNEQGHALGYSPDEMGETNYCQCHRATYSIPCHVRQFPVVAIAKIQDAEPAPTR